MKIEIDDNTGITACILGVVAIIALSVLGGCHICQETERQAIRAGMVTTNVPVNVQYTTKYIKP